jgi:NAD(P)-dependent dehydrogenase (short-subunit alcohol dehydrogenase family)
MSPPVDQFTAHGYDLQFGTNVIGHFLFTILLLPVLRAASKTSPDSPAGVVTTSSLGHRAGVKGAIVWETLKPGENSSPVDKARRRMGLDVLYYQSRSVRKSGFLVVNQTHRRLCSRQFLMTKDLAKRHGSDGHHSTLVRRTSLFFSWYESNYFPPK